MGPTGGGAHQGIGPVPALALADGDTHTGDKEPAESDDGGGTLTFGNTQKAAGGTQTAPEPSAASACARCSGAMDTDALPRCSFPSIAAALSWDEPEPDHGVIVIDSDDDG